MLMSVGGKNNNNIWIMEMMELAYFENWDRYIKYINEIYSVNRSSLFINDNAVA